MSMTPNITAEEKARSLCMGNRNPEFCAGVNALMNALKYECIFSDVVSNTALALIASTDRGPEYRRGILMLAIALGGSIDYDKVERLIRMMVG